MPKLYIFGIGGTGSRVLRSFTMLMAAGVPLPKVDQVIPIIIDPDFANQDLTRSVTLMDNYKAIHSKLEFPDTNPCQFFRCPIVNGLMNNYTLHIAHTDNMTFQEFIGFASMTKVQQSLIKMLFSDDNLGSDMKVGFRGNPNIGSVALNQIVASKDFTDFANSFQDGDKIFIISSIFGGTGASGFPLLLKTIREGSTFPNHKSINDALVGAMTILPYFNVKPDSNSGIDSATFISKTKSALAYYEKNVVQNGAIDCMYYLGDDVMGQYANHPGGVEQRDNAHLIELLAATAIIDFAENPPQRGTTMHKEFGIKDLNQPNSCVTFQTFHSEDRHRLYGPMTQFMLLANCLTDRYDYFSSKKFNGNRPRLYGKKWKTNLIDLYSSSFMEHLRYFCKAYREWLDEMKHNDRAVDLFNLKCGSEPLNLVTDIEPSSSFSIYRNYWLIADRLNAAKWKCKSKKSEDLFMEMYYIATKKLFDEKFNKDK